MLGSEKDSKLSVKYAVSSILTLQNTWVFDFQINIGKLGKSALKTLVLVHQSCFRTKSAKLLDLHLRSREA